MHDMKLGIPKRRGRRRGTEQSLSGGRLSLAGISFRLLQSLPGGLSLRYLAGLLCRHLENLFRSDCQVPL
jgi:hypothetical protein